MKSDTNNSESQIEKFEEKTNEMGKFVSILTRYLGKDDHVFFMVTSGGKGKASDTIDTIDKLYKIRNNMRKKGIV